MEALSQILVVRQLCFMTFINSLPMILAFTFIFGTILGSFLNVVILRHNSGMTTGGRSMCFSCGKTLHWHELLPVVSYVMLRGKCSQCKSGISLQYPVVEPV